MKKIFLLFMLTFLFIGCEKKKAKAERRKFQDLVEISITNSSSMPMTNIRLYIEDSGGALSNETAFGDIPPNSTVSFIYNCRYKINFQTLGMLDVIFNCDDRDRIQWFGGVLNGFVTEKGYGLEFLEDGRVQPVDNAFMLITKTSFPKNSYSWEKNNDANKYN